VKRECLEELKVSACFLQESPLFLTVTDVYVNVQKHTDVSFWFVIQINDQVQIDFCQNEYYRMEWFEFDKIPFEKSEPHMRRFLHKLESFLKKDKGNPFLSCLP